MQVLWLVVEVSDFGLKEFYFESACTCFGDCEFVHPGCLSSLGCISEYLAIESGGYTCTNIMLINCMVAEYFLEEAQMVFE